MPLARRSRVVPLVSSCLAAAAALLAGAAAAAPPRSGSACCGYYLEGKLWYDQNANGVIDGGEPPLSGWTVQVYNASSVLVATTTTNALGVYSFFTPVGCGTAFTIKQVVPSGWYQTFPPASGSHSGTGGGCSTVPLGPYNFGNNTQCTGLTKVYTLDGDFNLGTLNGVITNSDQLELSATPTTWPYAWVANAGEGTVSKVDIFTGNEVAKYFTGPPKPVGNHYYRSPSRTVIDKDGNCWVANRTQSPDTASVTQILLTGGDDRNLNTIIDTSNDANSNGLIEPGEVLPWGQDERIKRHYLVGNVAGDAARGMVIDKAGFLWVGLSSSLSLIKLDPNLPISIYAPNQPPSMPAPLVNYFTGKFPYGLALAPSGLIYMSTHYYSAYEFDPGLASGGTGAGPALTDSIDHFPYGNYGIAVDKDCNVWLASSTHPRCIRWDTVANTWTPSGPGSPTIGRGITVDFNNNVWMSCSPTSDVVKYANSPNPPMIAFYPTPVVGAIGVGVASDGHVIVTGSDSLWCKVNSTTGAVMPLAGPTKVGQHPYTYSDFTGSLSSLAAVQQGTWTVITDGGSSSIVWNLVSWTPSTPPGTSITIEARAAQTLPLLSSTSWTTIGSPGPLSPTMPGRYIETRARLQRFNEGCSPPFVTPILYDLTVQAICDTCEFVNCPPDTTIACETAAGAIFEYYPPLLESTCDSTFQISCSPPSGSVFPIGTTPVTCTAVNAAGDTAICTFSVTVLPGCDPTPTGACCRGHVCQVMTEHDCHQVGGIYFGNGSDCTVGCNYDCIPPPHHLAGWWKLDGATAGRTPNHAHPATFGRLVGDPTLLPGENVGGAYRFDGVRQYIEVAPSTALSLGTGDFTLDAWVKTMATGLQPILDRRAGGGGGGGGGGSGGYALYLVDGYPALQMGGGGGLPPATFALGPQNGGVPAFVADNEWHLVAVTVDRDRTDGVQFYVDGDPVGTPFDPTGQAGGLDHDGPLWIARSHSAMPRYFAGVLDEIEIIQDHLSQQKIAALHAARRSGKCPELCYASRNVPCCAGFTSTSSVTICNYDVVSHVYSYGLSPLSGGPGCGPTGPSSFSPASGTVTVGPGSCVTVPIVIGCPTQIPVGQTACYQVSIFNHDTGRLFACTGSVRAIHKWCAKWELGPAEALGMVTLGEGVATRVDLEIRNAAGVPSPTRLDYTLQPLAGGCCDADATSTAARLDGLPPGQPVSGSLVIEPGQTGQVSVQVEIPRAWLIGYERIALYGDDDNDGASEILGELAVRSVPASMVGVPGDPPSAIAGEATDRLFLAVPNPFGGSGAIRFRLPGSAPVPVRLRLFDLVGRNVRTFHRGRLLEPGEHSVPWDAADDRGAGLGTGMYFLKLETGDRTETVKVVIRR